MNKHQKILVKKHSEQKNDDEILFHFFVVLHFVCLKTILWNSILYILDFYWYFEVLKLPALTLWFCQMRGPQ